ncbi:sugar-transfer associated ATP-grasp domain-containing protein [Halomonas sp. BC04]|uniref:sugar-transfer associated ATP-grasp domain-containing protein n=1 Tax=Halomonas sp. BC04 TaxID=1403540 RepID=UPI0004B34ED9|nr:sugar-transfer associated ATP-grasp domain-containing protein [Halomonas sp. BC04]
MNYTDMLIDFYGEKEKKAELREFFKGWGGVTKKEYESLASVRKFQKEMGFKASLKRHYIFEKLHGESSKFCLMSSDWRSEVISCFNDMEFIEYYCDKNLYDIIVRTAQKPVTRLRCVTASLYDEKYNSLELEQIGSILEVDREYILKTSRTANGKGVLKVKAHDSFLTYGDNKVFYCDLVEKFGNDFLVQDVIKQHSLISNIHPESVNSLRMVTLRWQGEIHFVMAFLRVGAEGRANDNAGTGGLCVGVSDNGKLDNFAIDKALNCISIHPTTGYDFRRPVTIPNYETFKSFVINLHQDIPHHDFVSWDVAIGDDGLPVFIEHNFRGALWLYQLVTGLPLFRQFSQEIVDYLRDQKNNPSGRYLQSINYKRMQVSNKKSKKTIEARMRKFASKIKSMVKNRLSRALYGQAFARRKNEKN